MSPEEVAWLVGEMRGGDKAARRKLIESHTGLAVCASRSSKDKSEVVSAAYLRLVEAMDDFTSSDLPADKLSGYLKGSVEHAAIDVGRNEARHTARLHRKFEHGSQSQIVTYVTRVGHGQWVKVTNKVKSAPKVTALSEYDALDSFLALAVDDLEEGVIRLKAEGRSNKEVADRLGCSEQKVGRLLFTLEKRYVEKNP